MKPELSFMKTIFHTSALAVLLGVAASPCFAMMSIADVSAARAKELGMEIRSNAAGPNAVRVELEFETKGELKSYNRVELEIREGGKFLVTSSLREDRSKQGRVTVSFAADRTQLEKLVLRVVVQPTFGDMTGYELRLKDFVEPDKVR